MPLATREELLERMVVRLMGEMNRRPEAGVYLDVPEDHPARHDYRLVELRMACYIGEPEPVDVDAILRTEGVPATPYTRLAHPL